MANCNPPLGSRPRRDPIGIAVVPEDDKVAIGKLGRIPGWQAERTVVPDGPADAGCEAMAHRLKGEDLPRGEPVGPRQGGCRKRREGDHSNDEEAKEPKGAF